MQKKLVTVQSDVLTTDMVWLLERFVVRNESREGDEVSSFKGAKAEVPGPRPSGKSTEHPGHEGHESDEGRENDEVSSFKGSRAGVPGPRPSG